jgi:hypothetical protein
MYLTGDWHGYVRRTDGRRRSYQGRRGRAGVSYIDANAVRGFRYWREESRECLVQTVKGFDERVTG